MPQAKRIAEVGHEPSWQEAAVGGTTSVQSVLNTLGTGQPGSLTLLLSSGGHAGKRASLAHVMELSQQDFARMYLGYSRDLQAILPQVSGVDTRVVSHLVLPIADSASNGKASAMMFRADAPRVIVEPTAPTRDLPIYDPRSGTAAKFLQHCAVVLKRPGVIMQQCP